MKRLLTVLLGGLYSATLFATPFHHIRGLNDQALKLAQEAYQCQVKAGRVNNPHLAILDFTKPSSEKRLWVLDMKHHKVDYILLASHGVGSGELYATHFSNRADSHESSLGLYITDKTYRGKFGYSLRLNGIEQGINNNAYARDIVMHGATYVNQRTIDEYGLLGETWGCIGLDKRYAHQVINTIKNGSLIFAYSTAENHDKHLKRCDKKA